MRRDEIRIFPGDVETYLRRLDRFSRSHGRLHTLACALPLSRSTLDYERRIAWSSVRAFVRDLSSGKLSTSVIIVLFALWAFIGDPECRVGIAIAFTLLLICLPLLWNFWKTIDHWSLRE